MQAGDWRPARQRGFTYLWLLFFVAISSATLASVGQSWRVASQRERERELEFRGNAYARAIASYVRAGGGDAQRRYPARIEDLLLDRRGPRSIHHLRQAYADPFTGQVDWILVRAPGGDGFLAVRSQAAVKLLSVGPDGQQWQANERVFGVAR